MTATAIKAVICMTANATAVGAPRGGSHSHARVAELEARVAELEKEVAEQEAEIERLERGLLEQDYHVIDGYVVAVFPDGEGLYVATCPKLHASDQGATEEEAVANVRDAMEFVAEVFAKEGRPMPPKDCEC